MCFYTPLQSLRRSGSIQNSVPAETFDIASVSRFQLVVTLDHENMLPDHETYYAADQIYSAKKINRRRFTLDCWFDICNQLPIER
jgi:hypothetical protein